jgi:hypothetical protein
MLKHSGTGWAVAFCKRRFITARPDRAHVDSINAPVFSRKQDAQFFADVTIAELKKTGWFREGYEKDIHIVKVKSSIELV